MIPSIKRISQQKINSETYKRRWSTLVYNHMRGKQDWECLLMNNCLLKKDELGCIAGFFSSHRFGRRCKHTISGWWFQPI